MRMDEFCQIDALIKELDHQVDLLLKNQARRPTSDGDAAIADLLDRIATLEPKLKGPSKPPASTL